MTVRAEVPRRVDGHEEPVPRKVRVETVGASTEGVVGKETTDASEMSREKRKGEGGERLEVGDEGVGDTASDEVEMGEGEGAAGTAVGGGLGVERR